MTTKTRQEWEKYFSEQITKEQYLKEIETKPKSVRETVAEGMLHAKCETPTDYHTGYADGLSAQELMARNVRMANSGDPSKYLR